MTQTSDLNPNIKDSWGWTPLHFAVLEGHTDLVRMLIEKGADVSAKGRWEHTPLHCGVCDQESKITIVKLLIENGADVNVEANWGHRPLHYAVADGRADIVALLLEKGADINAQATWWHKHKYYAGHYDTVMLMINLGDGPEELKKYGITPLILATDLGHVEIAQLMQVSLPDEGGEYQ